MPTFDFHNVVSKLIAGVRLAVSSPVLYILAGASAISKCLNIVFDNYVSLKSLISMPEFPVPSDPSGLFSLILYLVDYSTLRTILDLVLTWVWRGIYQSVLFFVSLASIYAVIVAKKAFNKSMETLQQ